MLRTMLYIFLSLNLFVVRGQVVFYQDICKCGVTAAGFSTGQGSGSGSFDISIEAGSEIKKAILFTYKVGYPPSPNFTFNSSELVFDTLNVLMNVDYAHEFASPIKLLYKDVTQSISSTVVTNSISISNQSNLPINWGYWTVFLFVVYENPSLSEISYNIFINDKDFLGNESYELVDLNPVNINFPVGLSIYSDKTGSGFVPNNIVSLNSNVLGTIGGTDFLNPNWDFAGVKGHFYYQNGELFGLDDDTPDQFMNGTDGLADVSSYLINGSNSIDINLLHINYPNQATSSNNINLAFFTTNITPCNEFPTQTSTDTTLCQGATAQLFASGGQSYSWQPATGLSCTDCPNPIVTADSSRLYTVRIWNNDSCSVVRPVKVNVQPLPQFSGVGSTPTACGQNTGSAIAVAQNITPLPLSYSINGAPFAFSSTYTGNFANLSAGANTIILRDVFGCEKDTVIEIGVTNTTNAFFTATPNSGAAPLSVSFTNQSTNATNYNWFIESDFQGENLLQHTFDTSGNYTVTLIAWQIDPLCADTFSIQILVYDSLIIQIPNVFTPNGDGINDQFTITTNQPVTVEYHLFNRWGNVIAQDTKPTTAGSSNFVLPIWDGAGYSDGTYFYVIRVVLDGKEYEFDGFLERIE